MQLLNAPKPTLRGRPPRALVVRDPSQEEIAAPVDWVPGEHLVRVSPDAYLLDDPPPAPRPKSWQTWLPGHKPRRWALEVVSEEWKNDYEEKPAKYAQLGALELVIFDPEAAMAGGGKSPNRVPLQIYRRGADGAFVRVYWGDGPAYCQQLDAWVLSKPEGKAARLRIALDAAGTDIVPTAQERARELEALVAKLQAGSNA
ncbi:MAG: Uma2 family endonuclease [Polyangiaceae bacterium]|nr:Uma2 family endonuclease [Polyangiaceae bacterium]